MKQRLKNVFLKSRGEQALKLFIEEYSEQHQTKINRLLHFYGRIARVVAVAVAFYNLKFGIALFIFGYLVQFLGHAIEGTPPSFFRNPYHLLLGLVYHGSRMLKGFSKK